MRAGFASILLSYVLFAWSCGGAQRANLTIGQMPPGGTFTGVWFSPQYGELHMVQNGATVVGRYSKNERTGRIQGSVEGDVMRFEWTESRELIVGRPTKTKGHGYFRLLQDSAEDTWKLLGQWGNDEAETGGGEWNAVKSKTRRPDIDGQSGDADTASSSGSQSSSGGDHEGELGSESDAGAPDDLSEL